MQLRIESAAYLNSLEADYLFDHYGITRVGEITGFDVIGVPVYNAIRPLGSVLSVNSGKGLSKESARAGAIAEGIEYWVFEHPVGEFQVRPFDWVNPELLPLALGSKWTPQLPIPLECVTHWATGEQRLFPSDLLWMVHRREKRMNFQMTSNGQALGYSFQDAFLSGLYEVIERDAMAQRLYAWEQIGFVPPRVALSSALDPLKSAIEAAGLKLYLFYCTVDIPLPVYLAVLVDPALGGFFTTAGWGSDIDPVRAAHKAVIEAIQSRCVYIAGARDDLLIEDYDKHKDRDPFEQIAFADTLPFAHTLPACSWEQSVEQKLALVLNRLGEWKENVYFNSIPVGPLFAVKTVILGLEPPRNALWVPSRRSIMWVQACTDVSRNRARVNSGDLRPSLATCLEMCSGYDQKEFV